MADVSLRGGATIGWVNASWPFARLEVSAQRLTLSCLGDYAFAPGDVIAIEAGGLVRSLGGVRIRHNRADYLAKIVFNTFDGSAGVIRQIAEAGFEPRGVALARAPGFPLRWSVIIGAIVIWNVLFFMTSNAPPVRPGPIGPGAVLATALLFAAATAIRLSPRVQRFALNDGHHVGEIRAVLGLLQVVSGALSLAFGLPLLLRAAS